jgi:DNA-directed RNA polymerase specialized sigma24 family protein
VTRQAIYDRLRAIGVSVESADAVSEALEPLPDKKVEAFLLWLCGYTQKAISRKLNIPRETIRDFLLYIRQNVFLVS